MEITRAFFVREVVRLRRNIARIERGLNGYAPNDPRAAGQRQMLHNEMKCRELLLDLADHATGLGDIQSELRIQYMLAKKRHDRTTRQHPINGTGPGDDWWESLGKMQYLTHLIHTLDRLMQDYTPEEIREEILKVGRSRDTAQSAQRKEILHAIARAEGSAADRAHLVRHDILPTNGRDDS
jgi:hypothetical protein